MLTKKNTNRLLEYIDRIFIEPKTTETGWNYHGLVFDWFFENSTLSKDYLDVYDYFANKANCEFNEDKMLSVQFSGFTEEQIMTFLEALILLLQKSTLNHANDPKEKIMSFLKRNGYEIILDDDEIRIADNTIIGEGAYCCVAKMSNTIYKKQLLKRYQNDEQQQKRFKYEFENMQKLNDVPGVLKVISYDETEHSYLMEACEKNISDYLKETVEISLHEKLSIILQIATALYEAHKKNIIHRDLHLGNILKKGEAFLLSDFGLSKDLSIIRSLKTSSTPKNAHYFLDPLDLGNLKNYDKHSDMYSVGKIFEYVVSYDGYKMGDDISFIINKATNRNKSMRYVDMGFMCADITNLIQNLDAHVNELSIIEDIKNGVLNSDTHKRIMDLTNSGEIAYTIVELRLNNFASIIKQMPLEDQQAVLQNISEEYVNATGYGGFGNYDIFSDICFQLLNDRIAKPMYDICVEILRGCASIRFRSANQYQTLQRKGIVS